jgi:hypothetical protein
MATPAVHGFHAANMEDERRRVMLRIANGTKASSPKVISYRRQHPDYKGMVDNSTGSRTSTFFNTTNQRDLPFAQMTGGVLKNFKFAKALLDQRAKSSAELDALREGVPPTESPLLELSEVESRSLELNNLIQQLQDFVEVGDVPSSFVIELKNILRLYVALMPTFTQQQLADFQEMFNELYDDLDNILQEDPDDKSASQTARFINQLFDLTREFARYATSTIEEKKLAAAEILKRIFKLTAKGLRVPNLMPVPRTGSADPLSRTISRQDDEDDDQDDSRAIRASALNGEGDVIAESFGMRPDIVSRAFSTANTEVMPDVDVAALQNSAGRMMRMSDPHSSSLQSAHGPQHRLEREGHHNMGRIDEREESRSMLGAHSTNAATVSSSLTSASDEVAPPPEDEEMFRSISARLPEGYSLEYTSRPTLRGQRLNQWMIRTPKGARSTAIPQGPILPLFPSEKADPVFRDTPNYLARATGRMGIPVTEAGENKMRFMTSQDAATELEAALQIKANHEPLYLALMAAPRSVGAVGETSKALRTKIMASLNNQYRDKSGREKDVIIARRVRDAVQSLKKK